jgi:LemA protein
MSLSLALAAIAVALLFYAIKVFNGFVALRNHCDDAFAGIDVQLKRRWDLVPKLMAVVQGASGFEKGALQAVTEARGQAQAAQGVVQRGAAEGALGLALTGLFARVEAYPELKAVQGYLELQKQVAAIEDELQHARRYYNACVRDNNAYGQSFPNLLLAPLVGFKLRDYFQAEAGERGAPGLA